MEGPAKEIRAAKSLGDRLDHSFGVMPIQNGEAETYAEDIYKVVSRCEKHEINNGDESMSASTIFGSNMALGYGDGDPRVGRCSIDERANLRLKRKIPDFTALDGENPSLLAI